jgi:hypothetical protein
MVETQILNMKYSILNKKWQATYIAPLQPPTLATFRSWGSSAGAGRARPAGAKIGVYGLTFIVNRFRL